MPLKRDPLDHDITYKTRQQQSINHTLNSQKTSHSSPSWAMVCLLLGFRKKVYRLVTKSYCICVQRDWLICWLTHWDRVTLICVSKLTITGSDNGSSPDRRQAIILTNARILLIGPLGTNFSEILIEILAFSFKKMRLKVSSAKRRPFCIGVNVLTHWRSRVFVRDPNVINLK